MCILGRAMGYSMIVKRGVGGIGWGVVEEARALTCFLCFSSSIAPPLYESYFWLWECAHIILSTRYHSSTALDACMMSTLVAGALISNNGAPWWMTVGDGGGRNNARFVGIASTTL